MWFQYNFGIVSVLEWHSFRMCHPETVMLKSPMSLELFSQPPGLIQRKLCVKISRHYAQHACFHIRYVPPFCCMRGPLCPTYLEIQLLTFSWCWTTVRCVLMHTYGSVHCDLPLCDHRDMNSLSMMSSRESFHASMLSLQLLRGHETFKYQICVYARVCDACWTSKLKYFGNFFWPNNFWVLGVCGSFLMFTQILHVFGAVHVLL